MRGYAGAVALHQSSGRSGLGFALATTTMIAWGTLPVALSAALSRLDAVTITGVRFLVSTVVLAGALAVGRSVPVLGGLRRSDWLLLGVATVFLAANYLSYIVGLDYTTPADAQVLIQGAPLLLALSGVLVFREPFTRVQWLGFGVLVLGIALFSVGRFGGLVDPAQHLRGNAMIALAAVTWAVYGIAQKQLLRVLPSQHIMLCIYVGCTAIFLPVSVLDSLAALDGAGWAILVFCALNTVVAYGCFSEALQHWEASRVSAVLALVPLATLAFQRIAAALWPELDPGGPLAPAAWAGAATVVAGSLLTSLGASSSVAAEAPIPEEG